MFVIIFTAWNFIVFTMYGIDKRNARQRKWRISEKIRVATFGIRFAHGQSPVA